jgi:hypothetical protein
MKHLTAGIPAGVPAFFVFWQSFKISLRLQKVEEKMKVPSF